MHGRKGDKKRLYGSILSIVIVLIIASSSPGRPIVDALARAYRPVGTWLYRAGLSTSPFRDRHEQDMRLRQRAALADELAQENSQLRDMLDFDIPDKLTTVAADVVGRDSDPTSRSLLINRGESDGVKPNQAVLAGGYVVGKVSEAYSDTALVQLVTDPGFRMTVSVGVSKTPGIAKGSLGGLGVSRLLQSEDHSIGDAVYTSDIGGQVPPGLPIGIVRGLSNEDSLFRVAYVEVPVSVEQLVVVMVVT